MNKFRLLFAITILIIFSSRKIWLHQVNQKTELEDTIWTVDRIEKDEKSVYLLNDTAIYHLDFNKKKGIFNQRWGINEIKYRYITENTIKIYTYPFRANSETVKNGLKSLSDIEDFGTKRYKISLEDDTLKLRNFNTLLMLRKMNKSTHNSQ